MAINSICLRWGFPGWRSFQVAVFLMQFCVSFIAVATKREFSHTAELSVFKSVFVPILTYGHESWVMTERILSQLSGASGKDGIFVKSPRCKTGTYRGEMAAGGKKHVWRCKFLWSPRRKLAARSLHFNRICTDDGSRNYRNVCKNVV